jgi:nitroimidazol reductase NimA-like FMN-containing flavoprotein (pyridoxamine 5'-phosphate oxidase superfamily)
MATYAGAARYGEGNIVADDPELVALLREIVDGNRYLVLGTSGPDGVPWTSPVWYAHAGYREFFWVSDPAVRHSRNIAVRPDVSIVIFDSSLPPVAARAVYVTGTAKPLSSPDVDRCIEIYALRSREQGLPEWTIGDVQDPARHRLYRAVAAEHSILEPGGVDVRIPISQESLV